MLNTLLVILAYLIGSIPTGLVLSRSLGVDIRQAGSGNIGATNVTRLLGKKLGALTLLGDLAKAYLPMLAADWLLCQSPDRELWVVLVGGAAFLGHLFPVYLKFKGGKGVATALGVFLFLSPLAILVCLLVFVGVVAASGFVSAGSLAASALMPLLVWQLGRPLPHVILALVVAMLVWFKHRENIGRLLQGQEKSWKKKKADE